MAEMRRLLGVLRETGDELVLDPQPGVGRLEELVAQAEAAGLAVQVRIDGHPEKLPPGVDLTAYRVVQEALTNVRKHAGARQARVILRYLPDSLELEITDDGSGRGGPTGADGAGQGLIGMRERVALYGGQMTAAHRPGGGFAVQVRLPLEAGSS
jgi:signal transduction histidine kinase